MRRSRGYTLIEVLVVIALLGILAGVAVPALNELKNSSTNGAAELAGFFKQARAKGLASTLAYTVRPSSTTRVYTTYGTSCSAAQTNDTTLVLNLPPRASMNSAGWSVCYNTRGLSNNSVDVVVSDNRGSKTVRVVLGGGAKVL